MMLSLLEEVCAAFPTRDSPSFSQAPVLIMSVGVGVFLLPGYLSGDQAGGPSYGRQVDVGCPGCKSS